MPTDIYQAALAQLGTVYYGNVWLALASIAYTDEKSDEIKNVGTDLPARIAKLAALPAPPSYTGTVGGSWVVDWGPTTKTESATKNANLMYVVSYRRSDTGAPLFVAVCIRGTDTHELYTPGGLCTQLGEDLDVEHLIDWQYVVTGVVPSGGYEYPAAPGLPASIAKGTWNGLDSLRSMTATLSSPLKGAPTGAVTVEAYVTWLLGAYPGLPIIVTSHSLGGCQTTVMGALLAQENKGATVVPHPFAPPSAGNQAWAAVYAQLCPQTQIWWNTADVVPNAFQNIASASPTTSSLSNILNMWGSPYGDGPGISFVDAGLVKRYQNSVGPTYVHLANSLPQGNVQTLVGAYSPPDKSNFLDKWFVELTVQHFPPMYTTLMAKQLGSKLAPFVCPPPPA